MPFIFVNGNDGGRVLPPKPGVCQECAVDHPPEMLHNNDSLHWQYVAGWFDGEGHFLLRGYPCRGKPNVLVRVGIGNTHRPTLERVQRMFGGKVKLDKFNKAKKTFWQWKLHRLQDVVRFCTAVGPFLIEKRQEAEIVRRYCLRRLAAHRKPLTEEDAMYVDWIRHVRKTRSTYDPDLYARLRARLSWAR